MKRLGLSSSFLTTSLGATLSYVALLLFWLFLSDPLLESFASGRAELTTFQTIKDAVFVVLTAPLLYLLIWRTRKAAQAAIEELREEKAFIDSSLEALPDVFYAFDAKGKMLRWNSRAEEVTGYGGEEIARMTPLDFVVEKEHVKEGIETVFEKRRPVTVEARYLTKGGEKIPYEFTGTELKDSKGSAIGLVGTGRDITRRKELEEEKEKITWQERAWFAQELHDGVCQQLSSLSIMASLLQDQLRENTQESRAEALQCASKMATLISRTVKEVRALSHGAAPVDFTKKGLIKVMAELVSEVESAYRVSCSFEPEETVEVGDPAVATNLYRITQEALSNGIRHGKADHIKVILKESEGQITLCIEDDGKGIEEQAKGGIGLENMRRRAEVVGGALEVSPGQGGGTVVTCTVPEHGRGA